jgi:hypothetical protein
MAGCSEHKGGLFVARRCPLRRCTGQCWGRADGCRAGPPLLAPAALDGLVKGSGAPQSRARARAARGRTEGTAKRRALATPPCSALPPCAVAVSGNGCWEVWRTGPPGICRHAPGSTELASLDGRHADRWLVGQLSCLVPPALTPVHEVVGIRLHSPPTLCVSTAHLPPHRLTGTRAFKPSAPGPGPRLRTRGAPGTASGGGAARRPLDIEQRVYRRRPFALQPAHQHVHVHVVIPPFHAHSPAAAQYPPATGQGARGPPRGSAHPC